MSLLVLYASPRLTADQTRRAADALHRAAAAQGLALAADADRCMQTETAFYVQTSAALDDTEHARLCHLLRAPETAAFGRESTLASAASAANILLLEVGPRLNVSTAWSTNAVAICRAIGLSKITRIECARRYAVPFATDVRGVLTPEQERAMAAVLFDRMTECRYEKPLTSFAVEVNPDPCFEVDVLGGGIDALRSTSDRLGLAFDDQDLRYYTQLFTEKIGRNPTSVECFDMAQSNSEHSRHWFFCGRLVIDGEEQPLSLMKMVKKTQEASQPNNSVIAFHDNSSAIQGFDVSVLLPSAPAASSAFRGPVATRRDIIFSAETHNFPTGVAPFPGATTGTGGRIRDVQATGRGAHVVAGTVGYCVGNLQIPGYELPWESRDFEYPSNMASPLQIEIEASDGASDYGNKFGEPAIVGFTRAFGMRLPNGERREWVKPIMFSGGIGSIDASHTVKEAAEEGMLVVKVGGPAYRIGMGGGAASSVDVQGGASRDADLDFSAVQRGDAEMEQKMNRVIRACVELGDANPICSIHDQGAGGNGNVLKELVEPKGAKYFVSNFELGDPTLSTLELWGAEYQENDAFTLRPKDKALLEAISRREKVSVSFVGEITGDGRVVLVDDRPGQDAGHIEVPFDLPLDLVLGAMPRKIFKSDRAVPKLQVLELPADLTVPDALDRVLRLLSVGSKRFLTNKVDRSVTGLIAQQQCVGPLHTPLADVAVTALTHFDDVGGATAIGEQPIIGLVNNQAGARMAVGEALTNLVWAATTGLKDVKGSGNWMWAAKLPGEGAALHDACKAMCDVMIELGVALDGGKDSLSMAAKVKGETVKAPGELVISFYVSCPDVNLTVTPDLKARTGGTTLLLVDLARGKRRLGGSALGQVFNQLGHECPDLDKTADLAAAFAATQTLVRHSQLLAGHDRSDGGLVVALLEMAFAGNCGFDVTVDSQGAGAFAALFAEELGLLMEVAPANLKAVQDAYTAAGLPWTVLGQTNTTKTITLAVDGQVVVTDTVDHLRSIWEATSLALERQQCNLECVEEEAKSLVGRSDPPYKLSFKPAPAPVRSDKAPVVAIVREEGSNGDREMVAALFRAGFEVHDVMMHDLCHGEVDLTRFRGLIFVGGFSYADVCGSAKGWAATVLFNETARKQMDAFRARSDTFSLGVCNGCQLLALLGWVAPAVGDDSSHSAKRSRKNPTAVPTPSPVVFSHNKSGRFESRFPTVKIEDSPAIMLKGMAGTSMGVWVSHGEGQLKCDDATLSAILAQGAAPIRYVDDENAPTTAYPFNPNGSPHGIAGLCSPDGRHLAMMPHPERTVRLWNWPWMPAEWRDTLTESPWMQMFINARLWCEQTQ